MPSGIITQIDHQHSMQQKNQVAALLQVMDHAA
jgi:hypothetical protein